MPKTTHGLRKRNLKRSKEYIAWGHMIQRCRNRNHPLYKNWGGRGIKVCERWLSFENFFSDMGVSPEGRSLDRINNNGDYEPGNCRWATSRQQQNNRSDNKLITFLGETKTVSEWAEVLGIKKHTLYSRLSKAQSELPTSGTYYGGQISEDEIIGDKIIPASGSSNVREEELDKLLYDTIIHILIKNKKRFTDQSGVHHDTFNEHDTERNLRSTLKSRFHITKKL